jgi:GR25 family glycosyltransferase involved in LPS biosynthesis
MFGINNVDVVYYINLEYRKDRLDHITKELNKTNLDKSKIKRINGIYIKDFGILGCAKSHILALETFLGTNHQNCIIFEDDFTFSQDQIVVNKLFDEVFDNNINYDLIMLASNTLNETPTEYPYLTKILNGQTLSGYMVNRKFAKILLLNYKESVSILEKIGYKVHDYCFDIYMKKLQPLFNWYCFNPKLGKQIESYSDIENAIVDYGV